MTPAQQITALMGAVANQAPDLIAPCKANKTHVINIMVQWEDDSTPVPTAQFEIYRGQAQHTTDMVAKGKYDEKKVPPGTYRLFFPDIHESEIVEA